MLLKFLLQRICVFTNSVLHVFLFINICKHMCIHAFANYFQLLHVCGTDDFVCQMGNGIIGNRHPSKRRCSKLSRVLTMSGNNSSCTVYIGNLDERVSERVLYDILIQAGRVVDLHIPRDKETEKPKGYAFAEYESEVIADYAVKLFSGLVSLYNRTLKFAISGQDKASQNGGSNSSYKSRAYSFSTNDGNNNNGDSAHQSMRLSDSCRVSAYPREYSQVPVSPGVTHHHNGYAHYNGVNYDNGIGRRVSGSSFDNIVSRSRSGRYDSSNFTPYSSHR